MVTVENREQRIRESTSKIESPFVLDPTLCLYSPQDNVDALTHPRIAEWLDFIGSDYEPQLPEAERRVLLFMPCTKTKPYPFSTEHQAINQRLLDSGFKPTERLYLPQELQARLEPGFSPEVLNISPLSDGKGTVIHRMVISEPMAVVPYEHIAEYQGKKSPATAYDDPGLFEKRGNAVSPWRENSTATQVSATRWKWGDEERRHYVLMHNVMADVLAKFIARVGHHYTDIVAWVAPGLTHRSFVIGKGERSSNKVVATRLVGKERMALIGANDHLGPEQAIECLPTLDQCKDAVERLAARLNIDIGHATGIYARGGANATPLALPEMLDNLVARIGRGTAA
ncbi:hypothetical protein OSH11_06565 [Kaistia dalseonensis]|uniref:DUF5591 domain-containing protein n=1 Tax=Kaistia dalseonensis TaxID=410840 RepID=A0ABU0H3Q7_9HYPH|nr:hypothetical protein [Kaistia dalseonensis]MCX5494356.1 hypothetical protein [Kaistia dalseonensis]MDQ0436938.1 hypothetical protein [Kaistia dalseonensis]